MLTYTQITYLVKLDIVAEPRDISPPWRNTESLSAVSPFITLWTAFSNTSVTVATIIEGRFIIRLSVLSAILIRFLKHYVYNGQTRVKMRILYGQSVKVITASTKAGSPSHTGTNVINHLKVFLTAYAVFKN